MLPIKRLAGLSIVLATCFLIASKCQAAGVMEIRDDAGMFKEETIRKANTIIKEIKDEHKLDLFIQTSKEIPGDLKKEYESIKDDKAKRNAFFQKWARQRAKSAEVNGVYILLLQKSKDHGGHLQIEVG